MQETQGKHVKQRGSARWKVMWYKNLTLVVNFFFHPNITFFYLFFSDRLLSVLHGHSFFPSPPQRPMTSDFKWFSIPDVIHYIFSPYLNSSESISLLMLSAKQGNYWYHFYYVFGMTRSLTGDWTRDLPHSKPALYH